MTAEEIKERQVKKGVVFAFIRDGKILLEERIHEGDKFFGFIIIPGGGVETGENFEQALFREAKEEGGVEITDYLLVCTHTDVSDGIENTRCLYVVTGWRGELSNPEGKNTHLWLSITDAQTVCKHPLTRMFLEEIELLFNAKELAD